MDKKSQRPAQGPPEIYRALEGLENGYGKAVASLMLGPLARIGRRKATVSLLTLSTMPFTPSACRGRFHRAGILAIKSKGMAQLRASTNRFYDTHRTATLRRWSRAIGDNKDDAKQGRERQPPATEWLRS